MAGSHSPFVMGSSPLIGLFGGSFGSGGGRLGGVHDRRRQPDNPPEKERARQLFPPLSLSRIACDLIGRALCKRSVAACRWGGDRSRPAFCRSLLLVVIGVLWSGMSGPLLSWLGLRALSTGRWAVIPQVVLPELLGLCLPACLFHRSGGRGRLCAKTRRWMVPAWSGSYSSLAGASSRWRAVLFPWRVAAAALNDWCRCHVEQRALLRMLVPPQGLRPLWIDLLTFALCPALCEELFFRGAILRHLLAARADFACGNGRLGRCKKASDRCGAKFLAVWNHPPVVGPACADFGAGGGVRAGSCCAAVRWTVIAMHFTNNAVVVMLARRAYRR